MFSVQSVRMDKTTRADSDIQCLLPLLSGLYCMALGNSYPHYALVSPTCKHCFDWGMQGTAKPEISADACNSFPLNWVIYKNKYNI